MTRLSMVIAARNEETWLPEQLQALASQKVRPDEVILVSDGSTDKTLEIMHGFAAMLAASGGHVPPVAVIAIEEHVGPHIANAVGVERATGDWLYLASANDVVRPGAFAALAEAIARYPDAPLVTGDPYGVSLGWAGEPTWIGPDDVAAMLGHRGIVHAVATAVRRDAWSEMGGWPADLGPYCDTWFWHVLAARYGVVYTPATIGWVRPHQGFGGSVTYDRVTRRPYLKALAKRVMSLEEPTRSRLVNSGLWTIGELSPDMSALLQEQVALVVS